MRNAPISLAGSSAQPSAAIIAKPKAIPVAAPALIVFGYDEAGKAHASCFGEADVELAQKAAGMMGYHALHVTAGSVSVLADTLPAGRVFASGRAFVPFVKASKFEALVAAAGVKPEVPKVSRAAVENTVATSRKKMALGAGGASSGDAAQPEHHQPEDWSKITKGCLVLASEGMSEGWYEANVIEDRGDDLFVVRWRDWPENDVLVRRREHLALLPPLYRES